MPERIPFQSGAPVRRIVVLVSAGVVALIAIVVASLWLAARTNGYSGDVARARDVQLASASLLSLLQDAETGQRGFLLTRDRRYLEPYTFARPRLEETLDWLRRSVVGDASQTASVDRLSELIAAKLDELAETIALTESGRDDEALAVVRSDRGRTIMDQLRSVLDTLIKGSEAQLSARLADMRTSTRTLGWVSVVGALLILMVVAGAAWTVARYTRVLGRARQEVEEANAGLEGRVAERTADLTRANEEIQRFAYIVSHDLRAPLVNILGFTAELETGTRTLQRFVDAGDGTSPGLAEEARVAAHEDLPEAVGFIRASTTKMDRLINAILKLSREGRRELNPERVDLARLLETTRASVQHQLEQRGATMEIADALPAIHSDRLALEQIFGNLVDNAIKYLVPQRPGQISVTGEARRGWVVVTVADNGRGIAPADHERIFELFRRSGAQDTAGEGIGLAHVRALARRIGGDVTVESTPGTGSRFAVTLPTLLPRSLLGGSH